MHSTLRYLARRAPYVILAMVFVTGLLAGATWSVDTIRLALTARQDPTAVFEYHSISYVETRGHELVMLSDASWHQDLDEVTWIDVLSCGDANPTRRFVSSQSFQEADRTVRGRTQVEWNYSSPIGAPGEECEMRSTILAVIDGIQFRQTISSNPFTI